MPFNSYRPERNEPQIGIDVEGISVGGGFNEHIMKVSTTLASLGAANKSLSGGK